MRISDWSSDVCSSDLPPHVSDLHLRGRPRRSMLPTRAGHRRSLIESPSTAHPLSCVRPFAHAGINMTVNHSVLELIGNTPMVQAQHLDTGCCELFFTLRSEEHTSELQSLMRISYAVFCLTKKKYNRYLKTHTHYKSRYAK